jgi:hypothetical protein
MPLTHLLLAVNVLVFLPMRSQGANFGPATQDGQWWHLAFRSVVPGSGVLGNLLTVVVHGDGVVSGGAPGPGGIGERRHVCRGICS